MKEAEIKYKNDEISIIWKPSLCIHSTKCWKGEQGLPSVFNPGKRPWIDAKGASTEEIIKRIDACPSGALSYIKNEGNTQSTANNIESIIEAMPNGPLMVYGNIVIKDKEGNEIRKNKVTAFCRCGASMNKPFCDGSHVKINFKG